MPELPPSPEGIDELGVVVSELACRGMKWAQLYRFANGQPDVLGSALRNACGIDPARWHRAAPLARVQASLADAYEMALLCEHLCTDD